MMKMAEQITQLAGIVASLSEITEDASVPRNVRTNIQIIIAILKDENELSIKINKTMNMLDEISSDINLQSYTRTQIWNIMSLLEKL